MTLLLFGATNALLAQLPEYVSAQALIGWYALQNGAEDLSTHNRHAQVVGATPAPDRFNNPNSAYYFDGQNSLLSIEHHALHNSVPLTISLWMKPNELVGGGPLISKGVDGFQNTWLIETLRGGDNDDAIMPSYMIQTADMNDPCECGCSGIMEGQGDCGVGMNYDGNIFDGNWHLVTFVVSELEGKLHVDGTLVSTQNWAGNNALISNTSDILIGALRHVNGPWEYFKGFIDDIGIWNRALNDAEVLALYNEDPLPIPCNMFDVPTYENIVGHWPFCGNADDESPNDFHGQVNGALLTADAIGNAESAYHFANNSIVLPVNADFLNSDFSVYLEYNMTEYTGESPTLLSCAGLTIQLTNTCSPNCLSVYFLGEGYEFGHMDTPVSEGLWNSILVKRQEGVFWLYLNGMLWNAVGIEAGAIALNDSSVILGGTGLDSGNFTGDIDNVAIWTRALTDDEAFNIAMDSEFIVWGCTDPGACNYEPLATVDDWSCGYMDWPCDDGNPNTINDTYNSLCDCEGMWGEWQEGCTDPAACNFDWFAVVDDGSCIIIGSLCDDGDSTTANSYVDWWCNCTPIANCNDPLAFNYFPQALSNEDCQYYYELWVFADMNSNGIWEFEEPALNGWPIGIQSIDTLLYTENWGGLFFLNHASSGLIGDTSIYTNWYPTTDLTFNDWGDGFNYGVWGFAPNTNEANALLCAYWNSSIIHCEDGIQLGAQIHNIGSEPLIAVSSFTYDPILSADTIGLSAAIDSLGAGYISMHTDTIASLTSNSSVIHIPSPGMEYLNQVFIIHVVTNVYDTAGQLITTSEFTFSPWVACAYDPNDLTAISPGHYEPHFILADERILFRVRFQNTGNYVAEDVLIRDLLDPTIWNLDTFEPLGANVGGVVFEQMQATMNGLTGEASFFLPGVYLPDSTVSNELSQGYVSFYIQARSNLSHGTSLSNTAEIYFDNNPAIVTNTTNHTIFDCNTLTGINGDTQICAGETLELDATQEYVDSYTWRVADISSGSSVLSAESLQQGEYTITLQLDNPLCSIEHESTVVVSAVPNNTVFAEGSSLWVESGNQWQWFFEDEPIDGATAQTITAESEGTYSVLISNNVTCDSEGVYHFIPSGISEEVDEVLSLWPNPMQSECRIQLPNAPCNLSLYDASGRLVRQEQLKGEQHLLKRGTLECGLYQLIIKTPTSTHCQKLIIE